MGILSKLRKIIGFSRADKAVSGEALASPETEEKLSEIHDVLPEKPAEKSSEPVKRLEPVPEKKKDPVIETTKVQQVEKELINLTIGLDFGTSYTKIIIRDSAADRNWLMDFGPPYYSLLPSRVYKEKDRYDLFEGDREFSDLKWQLFDGHDFDALIAYLYLLIEYVSENFTKKIEPVYKKYLLDWTINVGIPSVHSSDVNQNKLYTRLLENYRKVFAAVLFLRENDIPLIKDTILYALQQNRLDMVEHKVFFIPEIIAEVHGFSQTRERNDDLYAIVDIGATTIDAAIFNLFARDYQDKVAIFASFAKKNGTYQFIETLRGQCKTVDLDLLNLTQFDRLPEQIFETRDPATCHARDIYCESLYEDFREMIRHAKYNYPTAPHWRYKITDTPRPLRIFLAGGGSGIPMYGKEVLRSFGDYSAPEKRNISKYVDIMNIDIPEVIRHRFAVAYGLSFPNYQIAEVYCVKDNI